MKVATWNVNSIRSRLGRLLNWLDKVRPDVLCLQELKCTLDDFPHGEIRRAGYHAAVFGQKTYNGVAILSRAEPALVACGLDDGVEDTQARLVAADVAGVRVVSAYVPNGGEVGSDKFAYKLDWMARLRSYLNERLSPSQPAVLCGDFNVAIDDKDAANPDAWAESVLCAPEVRDAAEKIIRWGLVDVFRRRHPDGGVYSWWDYRRLAFARGDGLRLDYVFATATLAERCLAVEIDRQQRKGQKPSDHAPVVATFAE